jgi:C4-dicarboxylate transporter DctM subunit
LGHLFTYLHIPEKFMLAVRGFNPWMVMILINVLIIFLGCFLEGASIILITVPVVYPVLVALGFDPIWFGIVLTANLEIAMLTPPVGMNLFVIQGITQDKISEVIQGAWPFIMVQTVNLAILMAFPILSTWLPGTMKW